MAPSSAGVLAALKRAREEKVKEFNALISVAEKLLRTIEDVERNLNGTLEKKVGKPIISRLHSFLIQSTMTQEGPTLPPFPPPESVRTQSNPPEPARTFPQPAPTQSHTTPIYQGAPRTYAQAATNGGIPPITQALRPRAAPPPPRRDMKRSRRGLAVAPSSVSIGTTRTGAMPHRQASSPF
jgi:hypothetical protein